MSVSGHVNCNQWCVLIGWESHKRETVRVCLFRCIVCGGNNLLDVGIDFACCGV